MDLVVNRSLRVLFFLFGWVLVLHPGLVHGEPADAVPLRAEPVRIARIQGAGATSPWLARRVVTEGQVTALMPRGFYLQDPDGDRDERTSEGLFVRTAKKPTVAVGEWVSVTGQVSEFGSDAARTQTELSRSSVLRLRAASALPQSVPLQLPATEAELERLEGMRVHVAERLTVIAAIESRGGRPTDQWLVACEPGLLAPTDRVEPGERARAWMRQNDGCRLQIQWPATAGKGSAQLRPGVIVIGVEAVLGDGGNLRRSLGANTHRLSVTAGQLDPGSVELALRLHGGPPAVAGAVRVAGLNLRNYFTTLHDGVQRCFPGRAQDCRGARDLSSFVRQRNKLADTLAALDADVLSLAEVENNGPVALLDLLSALNARVAVRGQRYAAVSVEGSGRDPVQVAQLYRVGAVVPQGRAWRDTASVHGRPPLAQVFGTPSGHRFAVVSVHFKSKRCDRAEGPQADLGDGQGCFNERRVRQARAVAQFAAAVSRAESTPDMLLIGDFNAHAFDAPMQVLRTAGFVDELARAEALGPVPACTYLHEGVCGRIDHVLASTSLSRWVAGAAVWPINTRAHGGDAKSEGHPAGGSDHDPVLLGFGLSGRQ